jgi:ABC-type dipeptide/oligopeptide/nickel transport system permease component
VVLIVVAVAVMLSAAVGFGVWWVARRHPAVADGLAVTISTFITIVGFVLAVLLAAGLVRVEDPSGPGSPPAGSVQQHPERLPRSGECSPRHGAGAAQMPYARSARS